MFHEYRDGYATHILCNLLFPQFIQPSGSPATEVMTFSLPHYCFPWLPAVAHYLRQNLLIFLHVPKYTDSNTAHHFKVTAVAQQEGRDGYLLGCFAVSPGFCRRSQTGLRCECGSFVANPAGGLARPCPASPPEAAGIDSKQAVHV